MNHPDDLERAISERQYRYRHQAYRDQLAKRAVRGALGFRLRHPGGTAPPRPSS